MDTNGHVLGYIFYIKLYNFIEYEYRSPSSLTCWVCLKKQPITAQLGGKQLQIHEDSCYNQLSSNGFVAFYARIHQNIICNDYKLILKRIRTFAEKKMKNLDKYQNNQKKYKIIQYLRDRHSTCLDTEMLEKQAQSTQNQPPQHSQSPPQHHPTLPFHPDTPPQPGNPSTPPPNPANNNKNKNNPQTDDVKYNLIAELNELEKEVDSPLPTQRLKTPQKRTSTTTKSKYDYYFYAFIYHNFRQIYITIK